MASPGGGTSSGAADRGQSDRDRDGFATLPRIPTQPEAMVGLGKDLPMRRRRRVALLTNRTIGAARGCWRGHFLEEELNLVERNSRTEWAQASPTQRAIVSDIFDKHSSMEPPSGIPEGPVALRRAAGAVASGYTLCQDELLPVEERELENGRLPKGAICPSVPSEMAMPAPGAGKIRPERHSGAVSWYYEEPGARMMKMDDEVDWEEYHRIKPYMDPRLRKRSVLLEAIFLMFMAGMTGFCEDCFETVCFFTVVKNYLENGELVSRIVWDLRRLNCRFLPPPWGALGSPAAISHLDLSETMEGRYKVMSFAEDVPCWFYSILGPLGLAPWFVVEGISAEDLCKYAAEKGVTIPPGAFAGKPHIFIRVLLMGWSWAPYFANTLLGDLLETVSLCGRSRRVVDGLPCPRVTPDWPVNWTFMDDLGVLALVLKELDFDETYLSEVKTGIKEMFRELGIILHKEEVAEGVVKTLGAEGPTMPGGRIFFRAARAKYWLTVAATEWLVQQEVVEVKAIESLAGSWTWIGMPAREALAVIDAIYACIRSHERSARIRLPTTAKNEFKALLGLGPFFESELTAGWSLRAYMADSSMGTGCLVWTDATKEEIVREAQFCERRGWVVSIDRWFTENEAAVELQDEDGDAGRAPPNSFAELVDFAREPLALGVTGHDGRLQRELIARLESHAVGSDVRLVVLDGREGRARGGRELHPARRLRNRAAAKEIHGAAVLVPPGGGAPEDRAEWAALLHAVATAGGVALCLDGSPGAGEERTPTPEQCPLAEWQAQAAVSRTPVAYGLTASANVAQWQDLAAGPGSAAPDLERVARRLLTTTANRARLGGRARRAPPAAACWDRVERWKLLLTAHWKREEHINILEANTILLLAKHLARSGASRGLRTLVFTDSMVALGMYGKGRSSARGLLRLARKMAVLRFLAGTRLILRHIDSLRMMADGPTRGQRIGEHPV